MTEYECSFVELLFCEDIKYNIDGVECQVEIKRKAIVIIMKCECSIERKFISLLST
jgi:hypothetical protein